MHYDDDIDDDNDDEDGLIAISVRTATALSAMSGDSTSQQRLFCSSLIHATVLCNVPLLRP